jgi:hypothetical protein
MVMKGLENTYLQSSEWTFYLCGIFQGTILYLKKVSCYLPLKPAHCQFIPDAITLNPLFKGSLQISGFEHKIEENFKCRLFIIKIIDLGSLKIKVI